MVSATDLAVVGVILASLIILRNYASSRAPAPLPPGPPADPLIGHLRSIPTSGQSEKFHEWCKQYGDIISLRVFGLSMIVIGSDEVAKDLLDKRGSKYSSRPPFTLLQLAGWFPALTLLPYGKRFMKHRKIIQTTLNKEESQQYRPIHVREARKTLQEFLEHPTEYGHILEKYSVGTVVNLSYGHHVDGDDDVFLKFSNNMTNIFNHPGSAGNTIVDLLPFLARMPSWFPGTYYANWARSVKPLTEEFFTWPYERLIEQKEGRSATSGGEPGTVGNWDPDSVISRLVSDESKEQLSDPDHVADLMGLGATLIIGGTDTTYSTACWFLLLMVANPEAQRRGQAEVDSVTGGDRLPTFEDRESLPYITAMVQEVLRWHPVVALGIPHLTTQDDIYNNMFIPKGSIVLPNNRGISWDERVYKDPKAFRPERFLPKSEGGYGEPYFSGAWGYGRRVCPGQWMAENSLFMLFASMLAVFNMEKARDEQGNEIPLSMETREGLAHIPAPFKSVVKPRSEKALSLIRAA